MGSLVEHRARLKFFFLPPSNTHNGLLYLVLASRFISQWSQVFLAGLNWHSGLSARKKIIVVHQRRRVTQSCCLLGIQVQNTIVSVLAQLTDGSEIHLRCFCIPEHGVYDQLIMQSSFCFPVLYFLPTLIRVFTALRCCVSLRQVVVALSHWWFCCSWLKGRELLRLLTCHNDLADIT